MTAEKQIYNARYRRVVAVLKAARKKAGLTQANVADKMGVNRTWVAKVEGCELRLDLLHFVMLCQLYRVQARDIIQEMEEE